MVTKSKVARQQHNPPREFSKTPIWDAEFAERWEQMRGDDKPAPDVKRTPPRRPHGTK